MSSAVVSRGLAPVQGSLTAFSAMKSRWASKVSRATPAASRVGEGVVEGADLVDEDVDELLLGVAGEAERAGDVGVAVFAGFAVELDDEGLEDGVAEAVGEAELGADLVGDGVGDAEEGVGEGHAGEALGDVHAAAGGHVAVVGGDEVVVDHLDGLDGEGVGEVAVEGGDVGFDGVGEGVEAGVGGELGGHGLGKVAIDDGDVGGDFEVGEGVFDLGGVVGDDGEGGDFGGGAGGGGDGGEDGLLAEDGEGEGVFDVVEGLFGVLVEDPHGLGGVDGRAAADGDDDVGLGVAHGLGALHDGLNGGVGLNAGEEGDLEAGVSEDLLEAVEGAALLHGVAAGDNEGVFAALAEDGEFFHRAGAEVDVAGKGETCHDKVLSWCRGTLPGDRESIA